MRSHTVPGRAKLRKYRKCNSELKFSLTSVVRATLRRPTTTQHNFAQLTAALKCRPNPHDVTVATDDVTKCDDERRRLCISNTAATSAPVHNVLTLICLPRISVHDPYRYPRDPPIQEWRIKGPGPRTIADVVGVNGGSLVQVGQHAVSCEHAIAAYFAYCRIFRVFQQSAHIAHFPRINWHF